MKNCNLTLTTPAVCFVTFGCICWLLGEKEEGWGGGGGKWHPSWKGDTWLKKKIKPLKRPMWVRLRFKWGQTWEIAKGRQSYSNLRGFAIICWFAKFFECWRKSVWSIENSVLVLLPALFVNTILFENMVVSTKRNSLVGEKFIEFNG